MSLKIGLGQGWAPSRFLLNDSCAYIQMAHLGHRKLVEPFMRFDLQNCHQFSMIDFSELSSYCDLDRDLSKSVGGMIFHMSRCGSTLATQMLRQSEAHVVIAEPDVLGQFLQNFRGSKQELVLCLRNLISLFADTLCQPGQKLIIKWSSWNIFVIEAIQKALPGVPACYQYRSADEVLVSLSKNKAEWMDLKKIRKSLDRKGFYSQSAHQNPYLELLEASGAEHVSNTELAARFIGNCCERALSYSDQLLMVRYEDLPGAVLSHMAAHFNMDMSGVEKSRARIVSRWDTKALGGAKVFESDSQIKKKSATTEISTQAKRYIEPSLTRLIANSNEKFKLYPSAQTEIRSATFDPKISKIDQTKKAATQSVNAENSKASTSITWL